MAMRVQSACRAVSVGILLLLWVPSAGSWSHAEATPSPMQAVRGRDIRIDSARRRGSDFFVEYSIDTVSRLEPFVVAIFQTTEPDDRIVSILSYEVVEGHARTAGCHSVRLDGADFEIMSECHLTAVIDGGQRVVETDETNNRMPVTTEPAP